MQKIIIWLIILICLHVFLFAEDSEQKIIFINATLIPMQSDTVEILYNKAVVVENGKIIKIEDQDTITMAEYSTVIDCTGKYLIPGLCDMHVHINSEQDLSLFLMNGVTSVRNMAESTNLEKILFGQLSAFKLRNKINAHALIGPTIYTCSHFFEGEPKQNPFMPVYKTPAVAAESVRYHKEAGFDYIKIYHHLSKDVYDTIIETANEVNIPVIGHVPLSIELEDAYKGMHSMEHLTGYINIDTVELTVPEEKLDYYAQMAAENNVWHCPTKVTYKNLIPPTQFEKSLNKPGMDLIPASRIDIWKTTSQNVYSTSSLELKNMKSEDEYIQRWSALQSKIMRVLHRNRVKFIAGTDCGMPFILPGYSLHEELRLFVETGFSAYEALLTATRNAAESSGKSDEFGTIETGKRADLVLLNHNPLDDISNTSDIAGVMVKGKWLDDQFFTTETLKILKANSTAFVLFPILGYSNDTSLKLGTMLSFITNPAPDVKDQKPVFINSSIFYSLNNQFSTSVNADFFLFQNRMNITPSIELHNIPSSFYGIGFDTEINDREEYIDLGIASELSITWSLLNNLYFGPLFLFSWSDITGLEEEGIPDSEDIIGKEGGFTSGIGLKFLLDNRDIPNQPVKGNYLSLTSYFYRKEIGSDYDYIKLELDYRQYLSIFTGHTIAFNYFMESSFGNIPFYKLPKYGLDNIMRGIPYGLYRDNHLLTAQIEYRFPIFMFIKGVVFGSIGQIFDDYSNIDLAHIHYAGGFGLRFVFNKKQGINLRLDFAFSEDGFSPVIVLLEAF